MRSRISTPLKALIASAAMLAAFAGTASGALAANSMGGDMFGISTGGALQNEDPTLLAKDLDAIASTGTRWVRIDINWGQIQAGGPSSYSWTAIDRLVQGATARGIKVLGIIAYTPSWARPSGTSSRYPPKPADYAAFAHTAVEHYSALGVSAYEVWNEPNISGFWTNPDPAAYTQMLKAAYPAIKSADAGATVLAPSTAPATTSGTSYSPVDFLSKIYALGGGASFDAVSHHPYSWPALPGDPEGWSAWHQMYGTSPSLRSVMSQHGDAAKKIWATEFGAPTNGPSGSHVSEATQAEIVAKGYALWKTYDWAGPLFTYQGRDLGTTTDTRENFFGLFRHDFSQKPAFTAYRDAVGGVSVVPSGGDSGGPTGIDIVVKGKGKGGGRGKAKGRVSADRKGVGSGRVDLRVHRRAHGKWRVASGWRSVRVGGKGRFRRRLPKLHPDVYRVVARYRGSQKLKAGQARSRKFRIRA